MKEQLFGDDPVIGGKVSFTLKEGENEERTVIGVVEAYKPRGEVDAQAASYFIRTSLSDTTEQAHNLLYIRVGAGINPAFQEEVLSVAESIGQGWTLNLRQLKDLRTSHLKRSLIPFAALLIVCTFLIINVALGLFRVLWQSINKRYPEIGLRRAMGATAGDIYMQFLGEILVLATFGLLVGCFFALQFPLLGISNFSTEIYLIAIVASVGMVYTLVIVCALYPSRQAATIHPATALHEE